MRVRQVLGSGTRRETYTLVDDDGRVVELVDDYLALCTDREHSPNTLRARAYDLKEWLTFLGYGQGKPKTGRRGGRLSPGCPQAAMGGRSRSTPRWAS
jgi:hypothetical protein